MAERVRTEREWVDWGGVEVEVEVEAGVGWAR